MTLLTEFAAGGLGLVIGVGGGGLQQCVSASSMLAVVMWLAGCVHHCIRLSLYNKWMWLFSQTCNV